MSEQYQYFIRQDEKINSSFGKNAEINKKELNEFYDKTEKRIQLTLGEAIKKAKLIIRYGLDSLNGKELRMNLKKETKLDFSKINLLNVGDKEIKNTRCIFSFSKIVYRSLPEVYEIKPLEGFKTSFRFQLTNELLRGIPDYGAFGELQLFMEQDAAEMDCEIKILYEEYETAVARFKLVHKD